MIIWKINPPNLSPLTSAQFHPRWWQPYRGQLEAYPPVIAEMAFHQALRAYINLSYLTLQWFVLLPPTPCSQTTPSWLTQMQTNYLKVSMLLTGKSFYHSCNNYELWGAPAYSLAFVALHDHTHSAQADLDLPRVTVIGNQSAGKFVLCRIIWCRSTFPLGKSSVVEAISGVRHTSTLIVIC